MKIVNSSFEILTTQYEINRQIRRCEKAGRICYKSEDKITSDSYKTFLKAILTKSHESVIEHTVISVKIICDRGVSHEIVRHRIASYSQESTRYCNYSKGKFGNEITVIRPPLDPTKDGLLYLHWKNAMFEAEKRYFELLKNGATPEIARSVLPTSLKTEIYITMNLRSWRNFFELRCSPSAHPQMREIAIPMLKEFKKRIPIIFDDIFQDIEKAD